MLPKYLKNSSLDIQKIPSSRCTGLSAFFTPGCSSQPGPSSSQYPFSSSPWPCGFLTCTMSKPDPATSSCARNTVYACPSTMPSVSLVSSPDPPVPAPIM